MSDPVSSPEIEAAQRAWDAARAARNVSDALDLAVAAAREALAPIHSLIDKYESDPIGGFSLDDFLTELRPLIYPSEEL